MWDLDTIKRMNRAEPLRLEPGFRWPHTPGIIPFLETTEHLPERITALWVDLSGFLLEGEANVLTVSQTGVALRDLVDIHGSVRIGLIAIERAIKPQGLLAIWEG